ncbi:MAG: isocitrate lyase/phosphoenolpyruvate mutase family protein [Dehalococcoidia bacterium]
MFPKKCGFFGEGKQVVAVEEHVQKVRAALEARQDGDFVIIARTDALAMHGWEETVRRCKAYAAAGRTWCLWMGSKPSGPRHLPA